MSARIDYVRIRLAGDQFQRKADVSEWEEIAADIVQRHNFKGKPYDDLMQWDRVTRTWTTYFNVWGGAAELFYHALSVSNFSKVVRLDYRVDLGNNNIDIERVATFAKLNAKNKRLSYDFHAGPIKSKRNGRDTGGPSLSVGSKDTNRRIALYERGHDTPGVEAQIAQSLCKRIIQSAYDTSVTFDANFHDVLKQLLRDECDKLCRERLLYPLEAFTGDTELFAQSDITSPQEQVIEQLSILWELLDHDAREKVQLRVAEGLAPNGVSQYDEVAVPDEDLPDSYYEGTNGANHSDDDTTDDYDHYTQANW